MQSKDHEKQEDKNELVDDSQDNLEAQETAKDTENEEDMPETQEPAQRMEELELENTSLRDKQLRLLAEFENFKKRSARERIELRKTAAEDVMVDLLAVLDDFERASSSLGEEKMMDAEGFHLIANKFRGILEQKGLQAMGAKGEDFDPDRHEAITEIPAPDKKQKGKVVEVIEEGYLLGEKIIRYARVVVGK